MMLLFDLIEISFCAEMVIPPLALKVISFFAETVREASVEIVISFLAVTVSDPFEILRT